MFITHFRPPKLGLVPDLVPDLVPGAEHASHIIFYSGSEPGELLLLLLLPELLPRPLDRLRLAYAPTPARAQCELP